MKRRRANGRRSLHRRASVVLAAIAAAAIPSGHGTFAGKLSPWLDPATLTPELRDAAAPWLAGWIARSRDAALAAGAKPVPAAIRDALAGYVADDVLETVRWCVACGDELTVQHAAFRVGQVPAVTLDHVIVFASDRSGIDDPALWAHELRHVMQYADWGVAGFARRYLHDYGTLELEAAEFRWQWMKQAGDPRTRVPESAGSGNGEPR